MAVVNSVYRNLGGRLLVDRIEKLAIESRSSLVLARQYVSTMSSSAPINSGTSFHKAANFTVAFSVTTPRRRQRISLLSPNGRCSAKCRTETFRMPTWLQIMRGTDSFAAYSRTTSSLVNRPSCGGTKMAGV
jgi:hypothetical protein